FVKRSLAKDFNLCIQVPRNGDIMGIGQSTLFSPPNGERQSLQLAVSTAFDDHGVSTCSCVGFCSIFAVEENIRGLESGNVLEGEITIQDMETWGGIGRTYSVAPYNRKRKIDDQGDVQTIASESHLSIEPLYTIQYPESRPELAVTSMTKSALIRYMESIQCFSGDKFTVFSSLLLELRQKILRIAFSLPRIATTYFDSGYEASVSQFKERGFWYFVEISLGVFQRISAAT
ncbi:hypothetical protein IFR05_013305, partial [Cadophora sp. M221]